MSEVKFTKGPWAVDPNWKCAIRADADGLMVAETDYEDRTGAEQLANAHLVAAAPEMYAALELSHGCSTIRIDGTCDGCHVSEVLAKARGER